ncbi:hypothetical protein [Sporosarcina sp. UB5]|uniref:hypothetical protein n=1 Tax=Sporosarcina sp. UB5 TaxID=3047463 RepID=UPI003D7BCF61
MLKRFSFCMVIVLFIAGLALVPTAKASAPVKGTFENVTYEDVQLDQNRTERRLKELIIKNAEGRTITLNIDTSAQLTVDSRPVTIDAFKLGMEVEVDVSHNRVRNLRGKTGIISGQLDEQGRIIIGTLHYLDEHGRYIILEQNTGKLEKYFFRPTTQIRAYYGNTDKGALVEGSRVKLTIHRAGAIHMDKVEILDAEKEVESIRKGNIQLLNSVTGKITIRDGRKYEANSWRYWSYYNSNSSFQLSKEADVYFGNELINKSQYRYYNKYNAFFITTMHFNKEIVEHVIIQKYTEKNLREKITSINTEQSFFELQSSGKVYFHEGTIFIRNKRIVDPISITKGDTAFIIAETNYGRTNASIVYIIN